MKIFFQNIETEEKTVDGEVLGELDQVSIFSLSHLHFHSEFPSESVFLSHILVKNLNFFTPKISDGNFLREFWSKFKSKIRAEFQL